MNEMITIKEAALLVKKVPLTVRRAIYKADDNLKSTNDKGHLLIDKGYITEFFKVTRNVPVNDTPINDTANEIISNELQNRQKTIDSLNDRLKESHHIIEAQRQELTGLTDKLQLLIEPSKDVNTEKVDELAKTIKELQNNLKKPFPLIEVISITACVIITIYIYLMFKI